MRNGKAHHFPWYQIAHLVTKPSGRDISRDRSYSLLHSLDPRMAPTAGAAATKTTGLAKAAMASKRQYSDTIFSLLQELKNVVLINCGGTEDVTQLLKTKDSIRLLVLDSRRCGPLTFYNFVMLRHSCGKTWTQACNRLRRLPVQSELPLSSCRWRNPCLLQAYSPQSFAWP